MSKAWGWLLVAVWVCTLFSEVVPLSWRAAVLIVPVSLTLVGMLHFPGDRLWRPPGYAALVGWFFLLLIQCVPLPPAILSFMSPGGYQLYSETVWILRPDAWMPLALVAKPAFLWFLQFMVIAGVFFMTAQVGADHARLGKLLQWFGLSVGLVALMTIGVRLVRVAGGLSVGYFDTVFRGGMVSLAALVPLVLVCHLYAKPHQNYGKWHKRLVQALRHPVNHLHGYLLASALLMSFAVTSFGPPQVQVALVCGLVVMTVMLWLRSTSRAGCLTSVVFSLLILVVVGLGTLKSVQRNAIGTSVPAFASLDRQSLVKDFVLFGAGPGNLPGLKMRYTNLTTSPAENKGRVFGLAVLSEGGLVGVFLTVCFWAAVLLACVTAWLKRRNRMSLYFFPGAFAGLVVCFAAGSDPFQPSAMWPGLTGYFLAALLIATSCFSSSGEPEAALGDLSPGTRRAMIFFAGLLGIAGVVYVGGKAWLAVSSPLRPAATIATTAEEAGETHIPLNSRLLFDPLEADHWFAVGNYWAAQREDERARAFFSRALRFDPLAGEPLYRVGALLAGRGDAEAGQTLMKAGLRNSPFSSALQHDHLVYLLSRGDDPKAMATLSRLLLLAPEETGFWLRYFEKKNISSERWRVYLPQRAEVYRQFGDYLASQGKDNAAGPVYLQSAIMASAEPSVSTELFQQIAAYFISKEGFDAALEVLRIGMEARPRDLPLLLNAAGLYQRLGITYRAQELYRKALLLDPDNPEARSMLDN